MKSKPKGGRGTNQFAVKGTPKQRHTRSGLASSIRDAASATAAELATPDTFQSQVLNPSTEREAAVVREQMNERLSVRAEDPHQAWGEMSSAVETLELVALNSSEGWQPAPQDISEAQTILRAEADLWFEDHLANHGLSADSMSLQMVEGQCHLMGPADEAGVHRSIRFDSTYGPSWCGVSSSQASAEWSPVSESQLWECDLANSVSAHQDVGAEISIAGWSRDGSKALLLSDTDVMVASRHSTTGSGRSVMTRTIWDQDSESRGRYHKEFSRR